MKLSSTIEYYHFKAPFMSSIMNIKYYSHTEMAINMYASFCGDPVNEISNQNMVISLCYCLVDVKSINRTCVQAVVLTFPYITVLSM